MRSPNTKTVLAATCALVGLGYLLSLAPTDNNTAPVAVQYDDAEAAADLEDLREAQERQRRPGVHATGTGNAAVLAQASALPTLVGTGHPAPPETAPAQALKRLPPEAEMEWLKSLHPAEYAKRMEALNGPYLHPALVRLEIRKGMLNRVLERYDNNGVPFPKEKYTQAQTERQQVDLAIQAVGVAPAIPGWYGLLPGPMLRPGASALLECIIKGLRPPPRLPDGFQPNTIRCAGRTLVLAVGAENGETYLYNRNGSLQPAQVTIVVPVR